MVYFWPREDLAISKNVGPAFRLGCRYDLVSAVSVKSSSTHTQTAGNGFDQDADPILLSGMSIHA